MWLDGKRFVRIFAVLVLADAALFSVIVLPRPVLNSEQWSFLEKQGPTVTGDEMFHCADCLNFALARRPIGGWDGPGNFFEVLNLPASLVARELFHSRQLQPFGTSKEHSDLATFVFGTVAVAQCAVIAGFASTRRRRRRERA